MIPKPIFGKVKQYVLKLRKEHEAETVGKTGLAAVPLEVGSLVISFLTGQPGYPRISQGEAEECCEYLVKQGLLAKHPWGGFMVPLVKGAAVIPPAEAAKPMVLDEMKKLGNERRDNSGWI
jgi:hypothetical protein